MALIEVPLPLGGISEGASVSNEQQGTSGYLLNVRPRDVLEKRIRIGQRPGLKKTYSQQIGGASSPITWMGSITTTTGGLAEISKESNLTGDNGTDAVNSTSRRFGQTFTTSSAYYITSVRIKCSRLNSPGNITVALRATDVDGLPTGSDLTTVTVADTTVPTSATFVTFRFSTPYALTSGTKYAWYMQCASADGTNYIALSVDDADPLYSGGNSVTSTDSGTSWSAIATSDYMFNVYGQTAAVSEQQYERALFAIGNNEVWRETSLGTTMAEFTDANGDIDTTVLLNATVAYEKIFVVNLTNLKVVDLVNKKLSTADAGANPCTRGMTLTGGTSNATMIVDYVDGVTDDAAALIYGRRTSDTVFISGETVTGTNADNNAVSFALDAAEDDPPHWYDWTVFGNDTATYGTMPTSSTLVALYRGRLVINDTLRPHAWYMSAVGDPFKFFYDFDNDADLSAVTYSNAQVGRIGDIITAMIPYKDDLFIFGCANSIWMLIGDPLAEGQLAQITDNTGIWGSRAWCIDNAKNLYFLGEDGIYRMPIAETSSAPVNISKAKLPNLMTDLDLDQALHRVVLSFDPQENGIIISKTHLTTGVNTDYFYSLITEGYFEESYPSSCGIFSSYYYPSTDGTYKKFLVGCADGYIREFDASTKNDATTSSTTAISSYATSVFMLGADEDHEGMLRELRTTVAGGATGGDFSDSDGLSYELHTAKDAETVLEDIKDGATAFTSGSWSTTGKQNKTRPRMRGSWAGLKLYNSTASETWSVEKVICNIEPKGGIK